MNISRNMAIVIFCSLCLSGELKSKAVIRNGGSAQLGDNIAAECLAKILSIKYDVPYYCLNFDLFKLPFNESLWKGDFSNRPCVHVATDNDVIKNKDRDVVLYTDIKTKIDYVSPEHLVALKNNIGLKEDPAIEKLPSGIVTVGVHIRKGNGGGQYYDGEQTSLQSFDFDRSKVFYRTDYDNFPFDWSSYQRKGGRIIRSNAFKISSDVAMCREKKTVVSTDRVGDWQTKFPPDQFYVDQIRKLSDELQGKPFFVIICTDDKNPEELVQKIKQMVNRPVLIFEYRNYRDLPFKEQINRDLYLLSHCDVLIRSQSYFSRIAELMGNHKLVIYPLNSRWEGNKLIMDEVVIKGLIKGSPGITSGDLIRLNVR